MSTSLPPLDNTMGALFIGVVLSTGLWGAGCVQLYYYAERFPRDDWYLKLLVATVWTLDTAHQALITHASYTYLVTHFADPTYLQHITKSLWAMVLLSGLICCLVQLFLVWRIWRLSQRNAYIVTLLLSLVFGELATVLVYVTKSASFTSFASLPSLDNISRAVNAMGAASDLAIALVLVVLLHRARTGFSKSETIINRLIVFSINTGMLTSTFAVLSLITITIYPTTFIYMTFFVCVSRLYTNTLYATLNARRANARGEAEDSDEQHDGRPTASSISMCRFNTGAVGAGAQTMMGMGMGAGGGRLTIKVDTETMQVGDREVDYDLDLDLGLGRPYKYDPRFDVDLERDASSCYVRGGGEEKGEREEKPPSSSISTSDSTTDVGVMEAMPRIAKTPELDRERERDW